MQFQASKFDALTDSDKPVIGTKIEVGEKNYEIKKVNFSTMSEMMKNNFQEPDKEGFDEVILKQHLTRPAVYWIVWCNEIK